MVAMSFFMLMASANSGADNNSPQQNIAQDEEMSVGQVEVQSTAVPSEEVNTIEESPIAARMTQAEKIENAKVNDSWGGAITIIAMSIVILALIVLSILFYIFGKISSNVLSKKKKVARGTHDDDEHEVDSGEAIAAIAMALSEHFNVNHDIEDTILTIRKLKRSYSPWNSKIYNLRQLPPVTHNQAEHNAL